MIDSREPLGESFSPGVLPAWKPRKWRVARATGLSIVTTVEFGRRLTAGARNTRGAIGGLLAAPSACREALANDQALATEAASTEEVTLWQAASRPLAH